MKNFLSSKLSRVLGAIVALTLLLMALPFPVQAAGGIRINIISVKQNHSVTVQAVNFPTSQDFKVRVGPFYTFAKQYRVMDTIHSGSGGTFQFTVNLPDNVKEGDLVAIRVDSPDGYYAYNAFYNNDLNAPAANPTSTPTASSTQQPTGTGFCSIVSVAPASYSTFGRRADFDAVWEVKNTSGKDWDAGSFDYKYLNGDKFYKRGSIYDFPKTVKAGDTVKLVVDMLAPTQVGTYTTTWAIVTGTTARCSMSLTIFVR